MNLVLASVLVSAIQVGFQGVPREPVSAADHQEVELQEAEPEQPGSLVPS